MAFVNFPITKKFTKELFIMKKCPNCSAMCKDNDFYCLKCNHPLSNENIFLTNDEYNNSNHITKSSTVKRANLPKCPTCGSTNIRHISSTERGVNAVVFGFFGNKRKCQFECLNPNCRYKW